MKKKPKYLKSKIVVGALLGLPSLGKYSIKILSKWNFFHLISFVENFLFSRLVIRNFHLICSGEGQNVISAESYDA